MKRTSLAALALGVVVAGCTASPTGTTTSQSGTETVVLHLATIDGSLAQPGQDYAQHAFIDALNSVSSGQIRAEVTLSYAESEQDPESALVKAISSGQVDGGWPATRAFAAAGIPGLQAIEAPFALTNYDAVREAVTGPVRTQVLDALAGTGIHGLGVSIAGLRRPFTSVPLTAVESWRGLRFKTLNSATQDAAVTALGGHPVHTNLHWKEQLAAHAITLDGLEYGLSVTGSDMPFKHYAANLVLWPKVAVLSINQARFDQLGPQQRGWIEAAARVAENASVQGNYAEDGYVKTLCEIGIEAYLVPAEVVTALRAKVQPALDRLSRDPAEAPLLTSVLEIAAAHAGVDPTTASAGCSNSADTVPTTVPAVPNGRYRVRVTLDDLRAASVDNSGNFTGTWTITVAHGTYAYTCKSDVLGARDCGESGADPDFVLEAGYLRGDAHVVHFVYDRAVHDRLADCGACQPIPTKNVGWSMHGDQLTFSDIGQQVNDPLLIVKPWTKVA